MRNLFRASKVRFGLFVVLAVTLAGVGLLQRSSAASGQLYVSPASASLQNGSTKSFQIRVHPSTPADSVDATLSYDKNKLQFISVSGAGSPFSIELVNSGGNGTVSIQRGVLGSTVSTDALVATVKFKALTGGNATASLDLSGYTLSGGSQNSLQVIDGSVTLTSASSGGGTTKPPSSGGGSDDGDGGSSTGGSDSGGSTGGSSGQAGSDGSDDSDDDDQSSTKPEIELSRREFRRLMFKLRASKKFRSYILFGVDKDQLKASTPTTKFGTTHEVSLPEALLIPGTTFYYKVVTVDEQGKKIETEVQNAKTKGYTVRLLVLDKFERRIRNSNVKLFSEPMEAKTDGDGYATFTDVAPGKHHVEYVQGSQTHSVAVTIQEGKITTAGDGTQTAEEQEVIATFGAVEFAAAKSSPIIVPGAIAAALLLALAGGYLVLKKRRTSPATKFLGQQAPAAPAPTTPLESSGNERLDKAQGVNRPDPGSVVSPNHDDKEDN